MNDGVGTTTKIDATTNSAEDEDETNELRDEESFIKAEVDRLGFGGLIGRKYQRIRYFDSLLGGDQSKGSHSLLYENGVFDHQSLSPFEQEQGTRHRPGPSPLQTQSEKQASPVIEQLTALPLIPNPILAPAPAPSPIPSPKSPIKQPLFSSQRPPSRSSSLPSSLSSLPNLFSQSLNQELNNDQEPEPSYRPTGLRSRKPNQLNPYTVEAKRYAQTLIRNDWSDAVVRPKKQTDSSLQKPSSSPIPASFELSKSNSQSKLEEEDEDDNSSYLTDEILDESQIGQFAKRNYHRKRTSKGEAPRPNRPQPRILFKKATGRKSHTLQQKIGPSYSRHATLTSSSKLKNEREKAVSLSFNRGWNVINSDSENSTSKSLVPKKRPRSRSPSNIWPDLSNQRITNLSKDYDSDGSNLSGCDLDSTKTHSARSGEIYSFKKRFIQPSKFGLISRRPNPKSDQQLDLPSKNAPIKAGVVLNVDDSSSVCQDVGEDGDFGEEREEEEDDDEEDEEEEEEEEEDQQVIEDLRPSKLKFKLLNRMMPKVYVTKAEKDLKLMEIEKRNGKLKLTIDSDEDNLSALHCSQSPQTLSNQKTSRRQRPKPRARSRPVSSSVLDWVQSDHNQNEQFSVSSSPPETIDSMPTRSNSPRKKQRTLKGTIGPKPTSVRNDHLLWKTYESSNHGRCNNLESGDLDSFGFTNIRDFSADFGIHHLRMGCKISGQLDHPAHQLSILEIAINGAQSIPVVSKVLDSHEIWGITFSFENTQSCEEWTNGLRDLIDRIQDEVMVLLSLESQSRTTGHRQSLNEIWSFLKRVMDHVLYQATKGEFVQLLMIWVKDLLNRLDDLVVDMINRVEFSQLMMFLTWGSFELVYRINIVRSRVLNQQISPDNVEVSHELGQEVLRCLIRRLLEYGPAITMSRLKSLMDSGDSNEVHDISIEIWSLLINLVLNQSLAPVASLKFLEQSNFWETLVQVARLHTRRIELPLVGRGEALSFLSMMICAISQFDSKGVVSFSDSRIDSCWSILVDSLGSLPETVFGEGYDSRSRVRRDQYIRSIFSRVLILNQRWGWKIEFDNGVIERMYKILNGNKLERLLIEANEPKRFGEVDSFPDVLKDLSKVKFSFGQGVTGFDCALKKSDTSFGIFLKALIQAQNDLAKPLSQQREKEFEKIISRCNPLRQLTFKPVGKFGTRIDRKITIQSRSSLINHSSLFLIYSILFPKTLKRQLSYLNNLYRFNNLDSIARKTHMKIWNKVSRVLKIQSESSILPVVEKIKESLKILIEEYSKLKQLEKNVRAQLKPSNLTRKEFVNGQNRANQAQTEVKEELDEIMEGVSSSIELVAGSLALAKEVIETWGRDEYLGHWLYPSEVWIDLVTWIAESDENLMKENLIALEMDRMINSLLKVRIKNVDQHREEQSRIEELSSLLSKNGSRFAEQQDSIEMDEDENRVLELEELKVNSLKYENEEMKFKKLVKDKETSLKNIFETSLSRTNFNEEGFVEALMNCAFIDLIRFDGENFNTQIENKIKGLEKIIEQRGHPIEVLISYILSLLEVKEFEDHYLDFREEILRIWLRSMSSLEFKLQGPFSRRLIELESKLILNSDVDEKDSVGFIKFLPQRVCWNGSDLERSEGRYIWWNKSAEDDSKRLERQRIDFFDEMFEEISIRLNDLKGRPDKIKSFREHEKFYKRRIGELSESISNTNRKLIKSLNQPGSINNNKNSMNDMQSSSVVYNNAISRVDINSSNRISSFNDEVTTVNGAKEKSNYLEMMKVLIIEIIIRKLNPIIEVSFESLPKLRILKHIF